MLNTTKIILLLLFSAVIIGKNTERNYKLAYPSYIPQNSSFDISLITSSKYPDADIFELYILPGEKINLNKVELKSVYEDVKLNFESSFFELTGTSAFKTTIDLNKSSLTAGTFFQILFNFRSENSITSSVSFYGIFKKGEKVLGYLSEGIDLQEKIITAGLRFFKSHRNAGRVLQIGRNTQFELSLFKRDVNNLLVEFWVKPNDPGLSLMKIKSKENPEFEFDLTTNEFQMLAVNSKLREEFLFPYFTGKKSWYHVSINFLSETKTVDFYCNSFLFAKYSLPPEIRMDELIFKFLSNELKTYQIELLRFIDFNNSIETSFSNRSYINFKADNSKVLAQFRFDSNEELLTEKNKINIAASDFQLVKSDAPLLARAPELNINLLSSSYELEWSGGDYKQADSYILEKSTEGSAYVPLFTIQADNINEKSYSYLDEKDSKSEIVYYRIKQINKDGSVVFSAQVKLGQGNLEPFELGQNYPNPFNPKTTIEVELLENSEVEVTVFNLEGQEIAKLHKGFLPKGSHKFTFDAAEFPSGIYLYKVATPDFSQTKKMILTK